MSSELEEQLREAACIGDAEGTLALLTQNLDINGKHSINGWTALHWAAKRGHEDIARILLQHGADSHIENIKGETPAGVCSSASILGLLGEHTTPILENNARFTPTYLRNPPLNGHVDKLRSKHTDFANMPTTILPASQTDDLVLNVRIAGSNDPDFIEIEIPRWKLTYASVLKISCEELDILESQVERIRKLPNTKLRRDNDIKRLTDFQHLEFVLKAPISGDKTTNCYQSISTCKNQTILY